MLLVNHYRTCHLNLVPDINAAFSTLVGHKGQQPVKHTTIHSTFIKDLDHPGNLVSDLLVRSQLLISPVRCHKI